MMKKFFAVLFVVICIPFLLLATLFLKYEVRDNGLTDSSTIISFFFLLLFAALPCIILWSAFHKRTLETAKWNPALPSWTMALAVSILVIALWVILSSVPMGFS